MSQCGPALRAKLLSGEEPQWLTNHIRREYLIRLYLATPDWVSRKDLGALKREARRRTRLYKHKYVCDHIIPITHKLVCGLNVPWNLRVITQGENCKRSNRWWEWTLDLFDFPEQLTFRF